MISSLTHSLAATVTYSSLIQGAAMLSIPQTNPILDEDQSQLNLQSLTLNRINQSPAYDIGAIIGRWLGTRSDESDKKSISNKPNVRNVKKAQINSEQKVKTSLNKIEPFTNHYEQLFRQDTLRVLYLELDPGVDDGMALVQFLATRGENTNSKEKKKVEIVGIVPCVGNAILPQTEQNTMQFLELTENQDIDVYPGAKAPLAIENNQTAINEMNQGINATHFYGHDGEADVGGWPKVNIQIQSTAGYKFAADQISQTSSDKPITLVSTSALTELSKTLIELEKLDAQNGLPAGSFAKNINAISIMGGCLNPEVGCNAPFNVPDNQKISEANFYFDSPAAQHVFSICQQYNIPILLAPLDLTQQPGLLWTKEQVNTLNQIPNPVAQQMARVTGVVPYLDAPCFPNGTYPMHDLQAATSLLYPDFYNVNRIAATIGDIGQIIINPNATDEQKNIYVLEMPIEKQATFYQTILEQYHNFACISTNSENLPERCKPMTHHLLSTDALIGIISGVASLALGALSAIGIYKWRQKRNEEMKKPLLSETKSPINNV